MRLSKRTEYGLRAMLHLARLGPAAYVQSRDLARAEGLPGKFLEAVLLGLKRHGYLESKVGTGGGYRLARPPRELAVGDLIRNLEGRVEEAADRPPAEATPGQVALGLIRDRLADAQARVLAGTTLEQLADEVAKAGRPRDAMYYI